MARIDSQTHPLATIGPLMEPPRMELMRRGGVSGQVRVLAKRGSRYQVSKDKTGAPCPLSAAEGSLTSRATGELRKIAFSAFNRTRKEWQKQSPAN